MPRASELLSSTGSSLCRQVGPPNVPLCDQASWDRITCGHHSLRFRVRHAADVTNSSFTVLCPAELSKSAQTRSMAAVTSSGAWRARYSLTASLNNRLLQRRGKTPRIYFSRTVKRGGIEMRSESRNLPIPALRPGKRACYFCSSVSDLKIILFGWLCLHFQYSACSVVFIFGKSSYVRWFSSRYIR